MGVIQDWLCDPKHLRVVKVNMFVSDWAYMAPGGSLVVAGSQRYAVVLLQAPNYYTYGILLVCAVYSRSTNYESCSSVVADRGLLLSAPPDHSLYQVCVFSMLNSLGLGSVVL